VDPKQVHITMKFLGDVSEKSAHEIKDALSGISCRPFAAKVHAVGAFPKPSYARVIYIGAHPKDAFNSLHADVEQRLLPLGFKSEKRAFTPHATIARVKRVTKEQKMQIESAIKRLSDVPIGTMDVTTIKLKKSTLTPAGAIYETLKEVHL